MSKLKPVTILLVDDNADHAELMTDAFREFNIRNTIKHVADGEQAIDYLRQSSPFDDPQECPFPDIVFLDLRMPRQDGIATLKIIKNDDQLKHVPVVMVSTSKTPAEIQQCYSLGASGYVSKPLQFEQFTRKIKELNYYWVLTSELPAEPEST